MPKQKQPKADLSKKVEINLDLSDDLVLEALTKELITIGKDIDIQNVNVNFVLKKQGAPDRNFDMNLTKDHYKDAERDIILPLLITEILKKEFSPKIAQSINLIDFIKSELKKDPYWASHVISLIRSAKNQDEFNLKF